MNYWKSCQKYEGNKKGGGGEDIIKLINFHLFNHFFFLHIFKVKFKLKFKDLFNYHSTFHKFKTFSMTTWSKFIDHK